MKLKMDVEKNVTILTVTESLASDSIPVLKAGLNKLVKAGRFDLILDLSSLGRIQGFRPEEFQSLQSATLAAGGLLVLAGDLSGQADAADRKAALDLLASPDARLALREVQLLAAVTALEARRDELQRQLDQLESGSILKELRRENSEYKKRVRLLEALVKRLHAQRPAAPSASETGARATLLKSSLKRVLESQRLFSGGDLR